LKSKRPLAQEIEDEGGEADTRRCGVGVIDRSPHKGSNLSPRLGDTPIMLRLTFESGTLVLQGLAPSPPPAFAGLRWDPRIQSHRAPAFQYRALCSDLRRAELAFVDEVFAASRRGGDWSMPELRPYQQAAHLAWRAAGEQGVVALPTGSGKTRLDCALLAACDVPSLCLVPTRVLLHQWCAELARHYRGAVGCLGDGQQRVERVTVATFEGAYRQMPRLGDRFGMLVVDEVHHFGAGLRDEALEMCCAPRRVGLTATAPDGEQLARICALVGPLVCELAIGDLAGEWLAAFDTVVLPLRLSRAEQARYDAAVAVFRKVFDSFRALGPSVTWADFVALAARSEQGRVALSAFRYSRRLTAYCQAKRSALSALLARHRTSRVLIFTSDNQTAYEIARAQLVMPITCDIDRAEREQALAAFRAGELRSLVSSRVLNEGIDVPDAEVAIIVGGSSGEREHVQRVGRLLRPAPGKRALVYELVAAGTHEVRKAQERRRALGPASAPLR
jgi:superfamily II DNA or RNA helicase